MTVKPERWTEVERYLCDLLLPSDPALDAALKASAKAGLPPIAIAPNEGMLLHLLARAQGAQRILEIGTLGGYSTIWLARALPADGKLVTIELEPKHAEVARANLERAGVMERVEIRVGAASALLPKLAEEGQRFDFVFLDADKVGYPDYFEWALALSHRGTLIVADNVVRDGAVADGKSQDPSVLGVRKFLERVAQQPRVKATALQTVGGKGYDGMAIVLVTADA